MEKYVVKWVVPDGGNFATSCATPTVLPKANDPTTSDQVNNDFVMTASKVKIAAGVSAAAIAPIRRQFRAVPKLSLTFNHEAPAAKGQAICMAI
jgi:hypothetical protein